MFPPIFTRGNMTPATINYKYRLLAENTLVRHAANAFHARHYDVRGAPRRQRLGRPYGGRINYVHLQHSSILFPMDDKDTKAVR